MSSLYASIKKTERTYNVKVDLVIICGDFQSIRNETDLKCISCPDKYKTIGDFHKYYSGEILAPYMTLFIGGNHESSNYLSELYYGGWVCKNIYYIGGSGVVNLNGLRIAGLSGIYKDNHFDMSQYEKMPYDNNTIRSVYHVRKFNWQKLMQMFSYNLGSTPNNDLLVHLKPSYWFSAHLHYSQNQNSKITKFLALDKCLPRRQFLQIIDIPTKNENEQNKINDTSEKTEITNEATTEKINLNIYENEFVQTAPYYPNNSELDKSFENPQTKKFCEQLAIDLPPF
ncbi:hypothetical protein LY90DRAFT_512566 [Neocallimastix californiae]|uniref:Lariat debranching enzyme C-terminal domain-containing protein n=1 Tax=Neocallimastix californiae TaxID=1754190 RepID=A0A1Y2B8P0_9FUNG|nr:hypothetical protein LY90DRAFT_512566 [Neocallimastix californiae]|eukprot:ORY30857.1 hypothetical protein LY90DRAFT_512566 [Neocallimastix californiae]